jgi:hypothetical protein
MTSVLLIAARDAYQFDGSDSVGLTAGGGALMAIPKKLRQARKPQN